MLRLEGIDVQLGEFRLFGDLSLEKGAHLSLIGPSGGGKSTLLNLVAGFIEPAQGAVLIDGRDMAGIPPARRPVTILFQEHNLFPHLDVEANVGLGLDPALRLTGADRARIAESLREVGLDGLGARRPAALSGGQRQRVALARALLRDRPVLLLDEPFAALGPAQRAEMLDLVTGLREKRALAVVMATHAPEDARRARGAIAFIEGGRIGPPAPADALLDAPPPALRAYLGD
ncbi:ATP-binding cassette domain-containing protein [Pikeienuella piscinae]|uniref:ATP-binding cassette domain-containing protein n=1 Tax=Pikeienuella piscinae TaxID=2748098 RepID=A0A7L5C139_9RHOB|nr:ATP-binding cassette domain-containing protein [Pikeienuella piscinae]QIE56838.1 ATP-binding cassette domain-containing protein [Pikeienuella piscinae]